MKESTPVFPKQSWPLPYAYCTSQNTRYGRSRPWTHTFPGYLDTAGDTAWSDLRPVTRYRWFRLLWSNSYQITDTHTPYKVINRRSGEATKNFLRTAKRIVHDLVHVNDQLVVGTVIFSDVAASIRVTTLETQISRLGARGSAGTRGRSSPPGLPWLWHAVTCSACETWSLSIHARLLDVLGC